MILRRMSLNQDPEARVRFLEILEHLPNSLVHDIAALLVH